MKNKILKIGLALLVVALMISSNVFIATNPNLSAKFQKILTIGMSGVAYAETPDYTCDGAEDNVQVKEALDALPATGGKLVLFAGDYDFHATVDRAIDNVCIEGGGYATYVNAGATAVFSDGGQVNWVFKNFRTGTGGITHTGTSSMILGCWINTTYQDDMVFGSRGATVYVYASNALNKPSATVAGKYYLCDGTADDVEINAAIDSLTAARTKKETVKLIGTFSITASISMPDYTILDLYDARLNAAATLAAPFIRNDDWTTLGNAACEIWGGTLIGLAEQTKGTWDDTTPAAIACAIEWFQPSAGVPAPITALGDIVPSLKVKDLLAINMKAGGIYYRGHGGDSGAIYIHNCQLYGLGGSDYTVYLYDVVDSKVESSGGWMTLGGLRLTTSQAGMFADNYWGGGDNGIYMTGTSRWNIFVNQRLDNCAQHFLLIGTYGTAAPQYNSFYNTHFRFLTAAPDNTYDCINITGGHDLNAAYNLFDGITYVKFDAFDARYIINEIGDAAHVHNNSYFNIQGDAPQTGVLASVSATVEVMNHYGGVDDIAVDGATTAPISSNWAFDHGAAMGTSLDANDLSLSGSVLRLDRDRNIILTAGGGWATTTAGCAYSTLVESTTNKENIWYADFDKDTDENMEWSIVLPNDFATDGTATITAQFVWTAASGSGNVTWACKWISYGDNEVIDAAYGTAQSVTDDLGTANYKHVSSATAAITGAGTPAAGEFAQIRVYRDVSEDGLTADARLMSVILTYHGK